MNCKLKPQTEQNIFPAFFYLLIIFTCGLLPYRNCSIATIGQESIWPLLLPILENKFVGARSWGVLHLNKVLVVPGVHAVFFKPCEHLVPQSFVTWRTSPVAVTRKLTGIEENKTWVEEKMEARKRDLLTFK